MLSALSVTKESLEKKFEEVSPIEQIKKMTSICLQLKRKLRATAALKTDTMIYRYVENYCCCSSEFLINASVLVP